MAEHYRRTVGGPTVAQKNLPRSRSWSRRRPDLLQLSTRSSSPSKDSYHQSPTTGAGFRSPPFHNSRIRLINAARLYRNRHSSSRTSSCSSDSENSSTNLSDVECDSEKRLGMVAAAVARQCLKNLNSEPRDRQAIAESPRETRPSRTCILARNARSNGCSVIRRASPRDTVDPGSASPPRPDRTSDKFATEEDELLLLNDFASPPAASVSLMSDLPPSIAGEIQAFVCQLVTPTEGDTKGRKPLEDPDAEHYVIASQTEAAELSPDATGSEGQTKRSITIELPSSTWVSAIVLPMAIQFVVILLLTFVLHQSVQTVNVFRDHVARLEHHVALLNVQPAPMRISDELASVILKDPQVTAQLLNQLKPKQSSSLSSSSRRLDSGGTSRWSLFSKGQRSNRKRLLLLGWLVSHGIWALPRKLATLLSLALRTSHPKAHF